MNDQLKWWRCRCGAHWQCNLYVACPKCGEYDHTVGADPPPPDPKPVGYFFECRNHHVYFVVKECIYRCPRCGADHQFLYGKPGLHSVPGRFVCLGCMESRDQPWTCFGCLRDACEVSFHGLELLS